MDGFAFLNIVDVAALGADCNEDERVELIMVDGSDDISREEEFLLKSEIGIANLLGEMEADTTFFGDDVDFLMVSVKDHFRVRVDASLGLKEVREVL